jgi:hypothetical protein
MLYDQVAHTVTALIDGAKELRAENRRGKAVA